MDYESFFDEDYTFDDFIASIQAMPVAVVSPTNKDKFALVPQFNAKESGGLSRSMSVDTPPALFGKKKGNSVSIPLPTVASLKLEVDELKLQVEELKKEILYLSKRHNTV